MINGKEIGYLVLVTIITAFAVALTKGLALNVEIFLLALLGIFLLLLINYVDMGSYFIR